MRALTESSYLALTAYLTKHERDIADGFRDYGSLMTLFIEIFNRSPEE